MDGYMGIPARRHDSSGLILGIFLTEPVRLAPHILTEPDGKTMSPILTVLPNFQNITPIFIIIVND